MPKIYDQDLRDKVIAYLEAGNGYISASRVFNLAINHREYALPLSKQDAD